MRWLCMNGIQVLVEYRRKIVVKYISFCGIGVSSDGVMKKCRGKRMWFSNVLYVAVDFGVIIVGISWNQTCFIVGLAWLILA